MPTRYWLARDSSRKQTVSAVDGSRAHIANIRRPRVAIALGGGGARGIAHVLALEALDEMGIRPVAIAGTSMGAVVGAAYAAGIEGTGHSNPHTASFAQPLRRHEQALDGRESDASLTSCCAVVAILCC